MTRYRYLDAMGEVVTERDFAERAAALAWTGEDGDEDGEELPELERVEYLGPDGDWRWAGAPDR